MTSSVIRAATLDDVPALVTLLSEFVAVSGYAELAPYDPDTAAETCSALILNPAATLFVAVADSEVVGAIGAMAAPSPWCRAFVTATEIFFYVSPANRDGAGRHLMNALRRWAEEANAHALFMGALERNDRVGGLYRRLGFSPVEQMYVARL